MHKTPTDLHLSPNVIGYADLTLADVHQSAHVADVFFDVERRRNVPFQTQWRPLER